MDDTVYCLASEGNAVINFPVFFIVPPNPPALCVSSSACFEFVGIRFIEPALKLKLSLTQVRSSCNLDDVPSTPESGSSPQKPCFVSAF